MNDILSICECSLSIRTLIDGGVTGTLIARIQFI